MLLFSTFSLYFGLFYSTRLSLPGQLRDTPRLQYTSSFPTFLPTLSRSGTTLGHPSSTWLSLYLSRVIKSKFLSYEPEPNRKRCCRTYWRFSNHRFTNHRYLSHRHRRCPRRRSKSYPQWLWNLSPCY